MASIKIAQDLRKHLVPISKLSLDPANIRLHDRRSIDAIASSLRRFGQQKPVVVDDRVVVAGNGLLQAAQQLKMTQVAAVRSGLAGVERIAYAIADNRTAELSTWDEPALRSLLEATPDDLAEAMGYSKDELAALLRPDQITGVHQDDIPVVAKKAVSKRGDVWLLGGHRLMCGSSTEPADVAKVMAGEKASLFATDPPYLVGYDGTNHPQSFTSGKSKDWSATYGQSWDEFDDNSKLYDEFVAAAKPHPRKRRVVLLVRQPSSRAAGESVDGSRRSPSLSDHLGEEQADPDANLVLVAARAVPDGMAQGQEARACRDWLEAHNGLDIRHASQR